MFDIKASSPFLLVDFFNFEVAAVALILFTVVAYVANASRFRQGQKDVFRQKQMDMAFDSNFIVSRQQSVTVAREQLMTSKPTPVEQPKKHLFLPGWCCSCLARTDSEQEVDRSKSSQSRAVDVNGAVAYREGRDSDHGRQMAHISQLAQRLYICEAWKLLRSENTLRVAETDEIKWIRCMGPAVEAASERLCVPPVEEDWIGPVEVSGDGWQCQTWFRWIGGTRLRNLTRCTIPAPLMHVMALYHEIDLARQWFPFVKSIDYNASRKVPAFLATISTWVPILPWWTFAALVHRGFANAADNRNGFIVVEFTPDVTESDSANQSWCGLAVPPWPEGAREMQCELATHLVEPCGADACTITFATDVETRLPRWLLPDSILCAFQAKASSVAFQGCLNVLRDFDGFGYQARIDEDAEGFYAKLKKCNAERDRMHHNILNRSAK